MNVPTILCFAVLIISNIALWGLAIVQRWWDNSTDEQLDILYERDKGLYEAIKLHKYEHKMKEGESNDNQSNGN